VVVYQTVIKYINSNAKIGVLYSSDGLGGDNIEGFKQGLGDNVGNILVEQIYEATAPTIDSQLVKIRTSGVDVFANFTTPKFAAMAIRKSAEMGWKPVHILHGISQSIETVLKPAGLENASRICPLSDFPAARGMPT
jgi:ABC-type branched-subunit amino acid transport system substrate-binding protein